MISKILDTRANELRYPPAGAELHSLYVNQIVVPVVHTYS